MLFYDLFYEVSIDHFLREILEFVVLYMGPALPIPTFCDALGGASQEI